MALTVPPSSDARGTPPGYRRPAQHSGPWPARGPAPGVGQPAELPAVHTMIICADLPSLAISAEHGQLTGRWLEGFYQAGRRLLARCELRVAGREPTAVQGRSAGADRARFMAVVRTQGDGGPDPGVAVERIRTADGSERITLRSSAPRPLRFPVEITLGTDLADLGSIAAGHCGPELPASVHDSGMRWTTGGAYSAVTADPPPNDALASAGLLRWEMELPPGGSRTIELRVRTERAVRSAGKTGGCPLPEVSAEGDDPRVGDLLRTSVDDLRSLMMRDPAHPSDVYLAAGVPWRCGLAPAEALWAARMAFPLGTRPAAAALRFLARTQVEGNGHVPGPFRDAGPHLPAGCTGVEATLAFPVVLAEARRWGLAEKDLEELLPAAERCLNWLRTTVGDEVYLRDPGTGGLRRAETQAHAHRAALLGAELLEACGRQGADGWREWAGALRSAFRREFWIEDRTGGRPAAATTADGRQAPHLGSWAVHLLDTGLLGAGQFAPGLLDKGQTEQLARLFGSPAMDSGWGLRGLGAKESAYNPFGHRSGAVRVHETALAVSGLAAAGFEKEAGSLLRGLLDAAAAFGHRLPEMYAGEQRTTGGFPLPHPAACRPAAVSAAAGIHVLSTVVGIRPDAPAGTVRLVPLASAPLGALQLSGLRVAAEPFAARVSRLGLGMVEEAADGLQLGV
ncbi:glycogen debranching N-terminal domain-containing protein [Streptomyces candidus]|uniref:Glycogen debranching enzyme n=1 Tax=Streptomyces candidus TaxID=67283 RepID=A0A7X0HAR9_9ACTN|nr:glycogen debranching enzyme [Streptomyces candidus]